MKNLLNVILVGIVAILMIQATCGKPKPVMISAYEEIEFEDWVYYHNMSITFDGTNYITLNGGNTEYSRANVYDEYGVYDYDYNFEVDGRTIFYDKNTGTLYAKVYGYDLYELDYLDEYADVKYSDIFVEDQSSPAFSPDGKFVYELTQKGYIRKIDLTTGKFEKQMKINTYNDEHSYNTSLAMSDKYFFIWGPTDTDIVVLDLNGKYVTTIELPRAGYGFSLSYCNDMLWIAEDADGSTDGATGYWYGYSLTVE